MKIYIIAHKDFKIPKLPNIYQPLQVGTTLNGIINDTWEHDNYGENISSKNGSYNELTGLYWIWKNSKENIIGLCHYRRYFVGVKGKLGNLFSGKTTDFLTQSAIEKTLQNYDLVVHNKTYFRQGCMNQYRETQKYPDDIYVLKDALNVISPQYKPDFEAVMMGKTCHLLNMMIGRKSTLDAYCEWLFPILEKTEQMLNIGAEDIFNRRIGMLGERLLDVWITHNHLRIKEQFTINTERVEKTPW